jgi:hypothetical protein
MAAGKPEVTLIDQPCPAAAGIRIGVFYDGRVEINGTSISTASLSSRLDDLRRPDSLICLHRETPEAEEPPPNMFPVLNAVIARKLPVAFFWDAAFKRRVVFKE